VDLSVRHIAELLLLSMGVASSMFSAIGILAVRNFYERLHYTGPISTTGVAAIGAAVLVREGISTPSIKVVLIVLVILAMNPVLTHATARAARVRRLGQWEAQEEENIKLLETEDQPETRRAKEEHS
jgi:multicomponent Na+:H+ antiporter subunit G